MWWYFCPCVCRIACVVILVYLLVFLWNLLRNFSYVLSGSGLWCYQDFILKMWGCRLDNLTFPGKGPKLFPWNGLWSFCNLSSEMIIPQFFFASFCCLTLNAYLFCWISIRNKKMPIELNSPRIMLLETPFVKTIKTNTIFDKTSNLVSEMESWAVLKIGKVFVVEADLWYPCSNAVMHCFFNRGFA